MKLVISAVLFVAVILVVFLRERRRWRTYSAQRDRIEAELPKLVQTAARRYEQKFGRAPSALEHLPQHAAKR